MTCRKLTYQKVASLTARASFQHSEKEKKKLEIQPEIFALIENEPLISEDTVSTMCVLLVA